MEVGKVEAEMEHFDVFDFCEEIAEEMQPIAKPQQIIVYEHSGQDTMVFLDPKLLKNCIVNLISNAIKYSGDDTLIQFNSRVTKRTLLFEVVDNGIGVQEEDVQNLFSPFFRANNATNIQGTGLGLNIVKRYAELMGGECLIESQENVGTTFRIVFNNH